MRESFAFRRREIFEWQKSIKKLSIIKTKNHKQAALLRAQTFPLIQTSRSTRPCVFHWLHCFDNQTKKNSTINAMLSSIQKLHNFDEPDPNNVLSFWEWAAISFCKAKMPWNVCHHKRLLSLSKANYYNLQRVKMKAKN